ncbi:MAG: S8 family serine peptidase [Lentisphaeria bacterium]
MKRWVPWVGIMLAGGLLIWEASRRESGRPDSSFTATPAVAARTLPAGRHGAPWRAASSGTDDRLLNRLRERLSDGGALAHQCVITFHSSGALREFLSRAGRHGLRDLGRIDALSALRVGYDRLEQLRDALEETSGGWRGAGANYLVGIPEFLQRENRPAGVGTVPYDSTRFLEAIGAAGKRDDWGSGVIVAVVDTGVADHPTLDAGQVVHLDLVDDGLPFNGHGTAMAGLIAGQDPQAPGVSPASTLLDVRVAGADGTGDTFTLAAGIVQAADAGAQVINISLGTYGDSQAVRDAVAYAESQGAVVVGSAGNDQTANQLVFPAAISTVVSVGGVDADLQQAYFSNSGSGLTVTAPAVGIASAYGADLLVVGDGTSQAAAITSGVLASGISSGATNAAGAAAWVKQNAKPLDLPPERGGAGLVQVPVAR